MVKWINKKRKRKGFTLVELVVVIAILGILATIAVPKLSASRKNAAIAAHNANVRILQSAATMHIAGDWDGKEVVWDKDDNDDEGWGPYLQEWPTFPKGIGDELFEQDGTKQYTGTDYKVTITTDAEIIVEPISIKDED